MWLTPHLRDPQPEGERESQWMPVSHKISRFNRCDFGLSFWLSTRSSTFSVFSLTHTERGLPLPGCRSIVPALRVFFNRMWILPHFEHLLWACLTDTWIETWKNLCVNKILLFIHKIKLLIGMHTDIINLIIGIINYSFNHPSVWRLVLFMYFLCSFFFKIFTLFHKHFAH